MTATVVTATPDTAAQPRRFKSRAAARRAFDADCRRDREAHKSARAAFWTDLRTKLERLPAPLAKVADLHTPHADTAEYFSAHCPECSGCCDAEEAPCATLRLIIKEAQIDVSGDPGDYRPFRRFEDYWDNPFITVTFAHHARLRLADGRAVSVTPESQHTMPLTAAERMLDLVTKSSRARIERMVGR